MASVVHRKDVLNVPDSSRAMVECYRRSTMDDIINKFWKVIEEIDNKEFVTCASPFNLVYRPNVFIWKLLKRVLQ